MVKKKLKLSSKKVENNSSKINPFELKFNRSKHNVLGKRKESRGIGHPGLSRKRAYEQREKSLGVEYNRLGKVNKIIDRRMGEKNCKMSSEEKAYLRFSAERAKHLKKGSKFNLADDDMDSSGMLTHDGKALTTIQKYDKTIASDDDDDAGTISADVVELAHFGGGDLSASSNAECKLSRKEMIADLIAKTRQARENKRNARDEIETMTEELDAKYLRIMDKVKNSFHTAGVTKTMKVEEDDYDRLTMSLKLNADHRATPAERTKTSEEIALNERSQLEALESRRIAGIQVERNKLGHLSVDSDGVSESSVNRQKSSAFEVRFDSGGKLLNANEVERVSKQKIMHDSDDDLIDEEIGDEDEEDLDDLVNANNSADAPVNESAMTAVTRQQNVIVSNNEEGVNGTCSVVDIGSNGDGRKIEQNRSSKAVDSEQNTDLENASLGIQDSDVPFIVTMPKTFEEVVDLLGSYPIQKIDIILERLMKCYHPSIAEGNKKLLSRLFLYLLRYYDNSSSKQLTNDSVRMLGLLVDAMYELMKFDVEFSVRCVRALIRQNWKKRLCNVKSPASFSLIALLRLVASLFPISESWHPVCSPALTLAAMTLSRCFVTDLSILSQQIFLVTVVSDFAEKSMKFVPEALAFCQGALLLAVENQEDDYSSTVVFPISLPLKQMLYVEKNIPKDATLEPLKISDIFNNGVVPLEESDVKRCQILRALIAVIRKYSTIYVIFEHTFSAIFTPFLSLLKRLPVSRYPSVLTEEIEALINSIESECKKRSRLTQMSRVITEKSMLKMLEPRLEIHFDPEKPRMNRDQRRKGRGAEKEKLNYLVKKEMRGAIKELRKDASFLSRKQRKETAIKDRDRREKTKRLLSGLQSQQSEWNRELWESGKKRRK